VTTSDVKKVTVSIADGVAVVSLANPPVNALGVGVREALMAAVSQAAGDEAIRAVVLTGEGRMFSAGADISEFGKAPVPPFLPDVIAAFEGLKKPVVVAISGAALGGGFELTLGCDYRVAAPGAKLGLPEVKLGLIPGAGGTQRLPRLVGPLKAFEIMRSGESVPAEKARQLGMIDDVADDPVAAAVAKARELAASGAFQSVSARAVPADAAERAQFEDAAAAAVKGEPNSPNIAALAHCVQAALDKPFAEGLASEREQFVRLLGDERSKALRYLFFAEREAAHIPGIPTGTGTRPIAKAAVIGAGTMGGGIAICFANAGIPVTIVETAQEALDKGLKRIAGTFDGSVQRGKMNQAERDRRVGLISGAVGLEAVADADIVVEAVFEEMGLKKDIFAALDKIAKPGAILATNTSYLNVNEIASVTSRPQDVVGLHFFSPANIMKLLEIVQAEKTAPDVLKTSVELAPKLGKVPVVVGVCHGFVGNRMLAKRSAQSEKILIEGALPHEVDAAIVAFGFRMGPYAMGDLAGLDIGWRIRKAAGTRAPVVDALCEQGRFGQKTGRGFYLYPEGARGGQRDPEVEQLIANVSAELGVKRRSFTPEEIIERLTFPMINEGARILEEGIASRPGDVDVIWIYGYNWPAWKGGPMHYADSVGLKHVADRLATFAKESGDDSLAPSPLLRQLADEGGSFADYARRTH
jgi:3-hydroxyacyl-CoA dehydrogenase